MSTLETNNLPPDRINTIYSERCDFFLSQWTWWIMREYKEKEKAKRPIYAEWRSILESGEQQKTLFVIDYENNELIEYIK